MNAASATLVEKLELVKTKHPTHTNYVGLTR